MDDFLSDADDADDQGLGAAMCADRFDLGGGPVVGLGTTDGTRAVCDFNEVVIPLNEFFQQQQLQHLQRGFFELTPELHDQQFRIHLLYPSTHC